MKLAAIYNVWDGVELLSGSMRQLKGHVDVFIIVWQDVSNYGEQYNPLSEIDLSEFDNIVLEKFEPNLQHNGGKNERNKRKAGLAIAKKLECSHFLYLDCDEYYQDFAAAKEEYLRSGCAGSVCAIWTYFQSPEWRLKHVDNYFVPFIHRLTADTDTGTCEYPYYVDPTRTVSERNARYTNNDICILESKMHHYSWVRKNIQRKVRNSSAKANIAKSKLLTDYPSELHEGYFLEDYRQTLVKAENLFGIKL